MKVIYKTLESLDSNIFKNNNLSVSIGKFETIHKGHEKIIKNLIKIDKKTKKVLITFLPNPNEFFLNKKYDYFLKKEEKINVLKKYKLDYLVFLKFDLNLKNTTKTEFINFLKKINTKNIVVGKDFYFGKEKQGNINDLKENFNVFITEYKMNKNFIISSNKIKNLINKTSINLINKQFLPYKYFIISKVKKGNQIGTKLGFKTANLNVKNKILPKNGVYATITYLDDIGYYSMTNIGFNPTIKKDKKIKIETHLINYNGKDFYNKKIKVEFFKYLRKEKKFKSLNELIKQLKNDKINAVRYIKKFNNEVI